MKRVDRARSRWSLYLYGIQTQDPTLYDIVIRTKKFSTDEAVDILSYIAGLETFQTTAESQQAVDDLALAARVKVNLIERYPRIQVAAGSGTVYVTLDDATAHSADEIHKTVEQIPGVKGVEVKSHPFVTAD